MLIFVANLIVALFGIVLVLIAIFGLYQLACGLCGLVRYKRLDVTTDDEGEEFLYIGRDNAKILRRVVFQIFGLSVLSIVAAVIVYHLTFRT